MDDLCPICGMKMLDTNLGNKYCPNHGLFRDKEKESKDENPSYIG
jgi:uncharacterized Zn finger protein (UPF0148 family)